jgi:TonB family protein
LAAASANLNVPSFGGLSQESAGGSGRNKKILIAAVVILALAALGYFSGGKPKFGTSGTSEPANTPQDSSKPSPTLKPMSSTGTEPAAGTTDMASSASSDSTRPTATTDKPNPGLGDSGEIRIGGNSNSRIPNNVSDAGSINARNYASNIDSSTNSNSDSANKTSVAPLQVKARAAKANSQTHTDESAPSQATLALASANDSNISNLMSPASLDLSKPSLAIVKISQGVSQGLLIKRVEPKYPQSALALHAQGAVHIEATINKEGSVINPKVLKGDPLLARAALDAVKQWRYKPYYLDGSPVEIQTEITINFKAN